MENIFGKRKSKITKNWRGNSYNSYILQKLSQKLQSYLTLSLASSKKLKRYIKQLRSKSFWETFMLSSRHVHVSEWVHTL